MCDRMLRVEGLGKVYLASRKRSKNTTTCIFVEVHIIVCDDHTKQSSILAICPRMAYVCYNIGNGMMNKPRDVPYLLRNVPQNAATAVILSITHFISRCLNTTSENKFYSWCTHLTRSSRAIRCLLFSMEMSLLQRRRWSCEYLLMSLNLRQRTDTDFCAGSSVNDSADRSTLSFDCHLVCYRHTTTGISLTGHIWRAEKKCWNAPKAPFDERSSSSQPGQGRPFWRMFPEQDSFEEQSYE